MRSLWLAAALLLPSLARADDPPAVLFVGDSHSAQIFGRTLDKDLRGQKGRVATFAVASSRPDSWLTEAEFPHGFYFSGFDGRPPAKWLRTRPGTIKIQGKDVAVTYVKTPKFSELLADYKPAAVIVALGSNGVTAASVQSLVDTIHAAGAVCFWIGPPRMRTVHGAALDSIYATLAAHKVTAAARPNLDSCRLIDSRSFSYLKYPEEGCDGIHYNCPGLTALGERWGHDAYNAFAVALVSP